MNKFFLSLFSLINMRTLFFFWTRWLFASISILNSIPDFFTMDRASVGTLQKWREYFPSKEYFIRPDGIVLVILLKFIAVDNFVAKSDRATSLNFGLLLIDFEMHKHISKKLVGDLNLLVVLILKNFLKEGHFQALISKEFGIYFSFRNVGGRNGKSHPGSLVADKCLTHRLINITIWLVYKKQITCSKPIVLLPPISEFVSMPAQLSKVQPNISLSKYSPPNRNK